MPPREKVTGPPDFIGVGTQRSGTTWWFRSLLEHPQIRGPRKGNKELHFLTKFAGREMRDDDIERYHSKFPRRPGQLVGEWTPRYIHDFWAPRLIRRVAPDAKLLVLFRDPIERFRSGVPKEQSVNPDRPLGWVVADAIERGRYASELHRLRSELPEAEILVLQYEKCTMNPIGEYRRTLRFLGVDADQPPPDFERPRGFSQAKRKNALWPDMLEALKATFEPEVRELAAMEPAIDVSLWPNFQHLAQPAKTDAAGALTA
jgi:hypothetical protein